MMKSLLCCNRSVLSSIMLLTVGVTMRTTTVHSFSLSNNNNNNIQSVTPRQNQRRLHPTSSSNNVFPSYMAPVTRNTSPTTFRKKNSMELSMAIMDGMDSALSQLDAYWQAFPYTVAAVVCGTKASVADIIAQTNDWQAAVATDTSSTATATSTANIDNCSNGNDNGDVSSSFDCNMKRNFAFVLYGSLYQGIAHEFIFNTLYPIWFGTGNELAVVVTKVAFNLFIQCTLLTLPIAYIIQATMQNQSIKQAFAKYVEDVLHQGLWTKCFLLWGPIQFLTFSVVPEHFRVTFVAMASFFWLIILSSISSNKAKY